MIHVILRRGLGLILIAFLCLFLISCGGDSGSSNNTGSSSDSDSGDKSQWVLSASVCEGLAPAAPRGLPTDAVTLAGWPENDPAELIVAKARSSEGDGDWTVTMVRDFPEHPASVLIPLHPNASPEGGNITLTFGQIDADGKEYWCRQEHDFYIEPLPPVDTTADAAATLLALRELGETVAGRYSQTLGTVREMSPEQLPEHLYPLYFSAHLLGNASDALAAQLAALPYEHRHLLDRLFTHIGFTQYLDSSNTEFGNLESF